VEYAVTQVFYVTDKNVSIAGNMTEALPFSQLFTCTTVAFKKKLTAILLSSSYFERINDDDDDDFMISTQFCVILLGTVA